MKLNSLELKNVKTINVVKTNNIQIILFIIILKKNGRELKYRGEYIFLRGS